MFLPLVEIENKNLVFFKPDGDMVVESTKPLELASELHRYGKLVVIDRDAASGTGENRALLSELCRRFDVIVGGGIRTINDADYYLRTGAEKVILGVGTDTELKNRFPRQRVLLAIDERQAPLGLEEWHLPEGFDPAAEATDLRRSCSGILYGLQGTEPGKLVTIQNQVGLQVFALGVIESQQDMLDLDRSDVDCLLDGAARTKMDLAEAFAALLDFDSGSGLLPTIIQDRSGQVLGLFHSNHKAVAESLRRGRATFWSLARGDVSVKESTQGQALALVTSALDCHRRALLYTVQASGPVCHKGTYSCFGDRRFSLDTLQEVLVSRQNKPGTGSYTRKILTSTQGVADEIVRQAQELAHADSPAKIIWETADLLYFVLANLTRHGIALSAVMKELRGRAGRRRQ